MCHFRTVIKICPKAELGYRTTRIEKRLVWRTLGKREIESNHRTLNSSSIASSFVQFSIFLQGHFQAFDLIMRQKRGNILQSNFSWEKIEDRRSQDAHSSYKVILPEKLEKKTLQSSIPWLFRLLYAVVPRYLI